MSFLQAGLEPLAKQPCLILQSLRALFLHSRLEFKTFGNSVDVRAKLRTLKLSIPGHLLGQGPEHPSCARASLPKHHRQQLSDQEHFLEGHLVLGEALKSQ